MNEETFMDWEVNQSWKFVQFPNTDEFENLKKQRIYTSIKCGCSHKTIMAHGTCIG
jgi:hypothetical protein